MRRRYALPVAFVLLALAGTVLTAGTANAKDDKPVDLAAARTAAGTANGLCPVMQRPVKPEAGTAEYRGEKIGFCCPGCIAKFKADPVRYMEALRADPARYAYASRWPTADAMDKAKAVTLSANGLCPVMQRLVTKQGGAVMVGDQRIAFCCPGCVAKFRANTETYMRAMRADPTGYDYDRPGPTNAQLRAAREGAASVNGLCPVMGRLVKANAGSVEVHGMRVAFCCPGCVAKFRANSEAYLERMKAEPAVYGYLPGAATTTSAAGDGR